MEKKRILKFHIGRGGRFNSPGYIKFLNFERIDEGQAYNECFFDENNNLIECEGNAIEAEIYEDGTGFINQDHGYDTTTCIAEDNLGILYIKAVLHEDSDSIYAEELKDIIEKYYPEFID